MSYTETNWQNGVTPINQTNLNKIENELESLDNGLSNLTNYSTEQVVGKWINNKNIYRKVIEISSGFDTSMNVAHNISNFEDLVDVRGWNKTAGTFKPFPTIYQPDISTFAASVYLVDSSNVQLILSNWVVSYVTNIVLIIEYTKTTD